LGRVELTFEPCKVCGHALAGLGTTLGPLSTEVVA
jgi:hypothetical protein